VKTHPKDPKVVKMKILKRSFSLASKIRSEMIGAIHSPVASIRLKGINVGKGYPAFSDHASDTMVKSVKRKNMPKQKPYAS
jgi:hypothetical protein